MSGWRSKKAMSNYRFSWTQPYQIQPLRFGSAHKEMIIIETIDRLVESGLTHPHADAIIKSIVNTLEGKQ